MGIDIFNSGDDSLDDCVVGSDIFGNSMEIHRVNGNIIDIAIYSDFRQRIRGLRLKEEFAIKMAKYILCKYSKENDNV